jgi:hypothetical protein
MRLASTLTLAALTLGGCSFVTEGELEEIKAQIDSDGDGTADPVDCQPTNSSVGPGMPEIPADGIDNDCDNGDLLDADEDGWPVITEDDYRQVVATLQGVDVSQADYVWPDGLLIQADCDDADPLVNPAAADAPYDGIDADCGCSDGTPETDCNDFDVDGDGQSPRMVDGVDIEALAREFFAANPGVADLQDPNLFGDCDDADPDILTSADADPWYDGIDSNCDGVNDFDQDGDGYIRTADRPAYQVFLERFHPDGPPASWSPAGTDAGPLDGDCVDGPIPDYPLPIVPALIHPGAAESAVPDGIDSNCDGANDYDQDGDGVASDQFTQDDLDDFRRHWSGFDGFNLATQNYPDTISTWDARVGDCDDADPAIYPGQIESLFTDVDYDCDGGVSTGPFGYGGYDWREPEHPRAVVTDTDIVIGTTAQWSRKPQLGGAIIREQPAFTIRFDAATARSEDSGVDQRWDNIIPTQDPRVHGSSFDMVADGDTFWVASSFLDTSTGSNITRVIVARHAPNAAGYTWLARFTPSGTPSLSATSGLDTDLDLGLYDGFLWATMSGTGAGTDVSGSLRTAVVNIGQFNNPNGTFERLGSTAVPNNDGGTCLMREVGDELQMVLCDDTGCDVYEGDATVEPATSSPILDTTSTFPAGPYTEADTKDGLSLLVRSGTGGFTVLEGDVPLGTWRSGEQVLSGDAVYADTTGDGVEDTLFLATVVQGNPNTIEFGWVPAGSLTDPVTWITLSTEDDNPNYERCDPASTATPCDLLPPGRSIEPDRVELVATDTRLGVIYTGRSVDIPFPDLAPGEARDALGWAFFSYYPDVDGDGFPGSMSVDPLLRDSDDTDPSVGPSPAP